MDQGDNDYEFRNDKGTRTRVVTLDGTNQDWAITAGRCMGTSFLIIFFHNRPGLRAKKFHQRKKQEPGFTIAFRKSMRVHAVIQRTWIMRMTSS